MKFKAMALALFLVLLAPAAMAQSVEYDFVPHTLDTGGEEESENTEGQDAEAAAVEQSLVERIMSLLGMNGSSDE